MEYNYYEVNKLPVVTIDSFYSEESEEKIMQELLFLNNDEKKLRTPENSGSAWIKDENYPNNKKFLKKNKAVCLDVIYSDRNISNILNENRKLFSDEVIDSLINFNFIFRYLRYADIDSTLVSYYEDSDYYLPHTDSSVLTAITWFYKKPKSFSGGNIVIENSLEIECLSNRCVIFPSICYHSVKEINISSELRNKNYGRFAITQFSSFIIM